MIYTLPFGHTSAQTLEFPYPINIPKRVLEERGVPQRDGSLGYKVKKYGNGIMGNNNASWRNGRGLNKGQRSKKLVVGKIAKR